MLNEKWKIGDSIYTIIHIDEVKGILWIEPLSTRGIWLIKLETFLDAKPEPA